MKQNIKYNLPKGFVFILAILGSITPLAIDVYLPAFKNIANYFYTSIDEVEITLSIYLLGFSLGQLIGGPLSDRYGRKIFIFTGLCIYITFSLLISQASSIHELWTFRFFQAIGGGFAVVNTNAIIRDIYHGKESARVFSIISMIMMVAPMIAPIIGTTILSFYSWKYIFIFLAIYTFCIIYFITKLPETSPKTKNKNIFKSYGRIFLNKKAILLILAGGFGFSGMFVYITKSSFIYMDYFGVDAKHFTLLFGLNVFTLIIFSRLNMHFLKKYATFTLLRFGVSLQLLSAIGLYTFNEHNTIISVAIFIMIYVGALGFIFANAIALVLEDFGDISATTNSLYGVIGFIIASFVGFLASYFHDDTLSPIFILMATTSTLSFLILLYIKKFKV
ncbi:multidrug effflux MFS transporter [Arcobacter sp.]|uniref:multidrug effflux MFS transporter n=1 Tax=unclassified Arcobacter TaxID=2593671 RepID=UPI003AFF7B0B